eukprot:CAMPEP_0172444438 /NCGR_PEP_ID=MMETSP1065-20121228/4486_1 /TAXON_ID=265537 /ORGANISM="Amphiprora paludosa, Strain CCMP125" /LENGTH=45 /DNA_ID= /DNA_START= /DNA_END= /DNA_ORIENTATION=
MEGSEEGEFEALGDMDVEGNEDGDCVGANGEDVTGGTVGTDRVGL